MKTSSFLAAGLLFLAGFACAARAAGTLTPVGSPQQPIAIRSHQVNVTINNGFAQTEVLQTFFNPNAADLEAVYSFPVPKGASLSDVTITTGERTLQGEVVAKAEAQAAYEEEKQAGRDAGLASKNSYQTFEFRVAPVRAGSEVTLRFLYYQPLAIDTGVGRYVYPLEDGGTDEVAKGFWTANPQVDGPLSVNVELKSAWPVTDVRAPGLEGVANVQKLGEGHYRLTADRAGGKLDRDFVFYYRLAENLPGRVEVIPYRAGNDKPGTFMMVVTPGMDLQAITTGADYVYVLDVSGSMQGKIQTLASGVAKAIGSLKPADRFRVVTFSNSASEVVGWTSATPENVQSAVAVIQSLAVQGGTNVYEGLQLALQGLDADRATSLVLVTDGVTNQGIVDPRKFHELLKSHDVRVFGFLMGNSANWPLMRVIADASGGFYSGVSNGDDIVGQLMLARSKITYESLHDASFKFSGARVFDTTGDLPGKIYRGQQLVIFGRYEGKGRSTLTLNARLTGEDKKYTTTFDFPEVNTDNPEIERLWAMEQIEMIELKESIGVVPAYEAKEGIESLGVAYQLVTDHTSMVVLDDDAFNRRGIARNNLQRTALERQAQVTRAQQATPVNYRVDTAQPMFTGNAPHVAGGQGGGAIDPVTLNVMLFVFLGAAAIYGRRHIRSGGKE